MVIIKAVQSIFGFMYAVFAERFFIYNVVPAICVMTGAMYAALLPLQYYSCKKKIFGGYIAGKTEPVKKRYEKEIRGKKKEGLPDSSDEVIRLEILRDREVRKISRRYILPGADPAYRICSFLCICLLFCVLTRLPSVLPRLAYIEKNLIDMVERYGLTAEFYKVSPFSGSSAGSDFSSIAARSLYTFVPSKWKALSKGMPTLSMVIEGVQSGMMNVCGINGVSLGCSTSDLFRDGVYGGIIFLLCANIILSAHGIVSSAMHKEKGSLAAAIVGMAVRFFVLVWLPLIVVIEILSFFVWERMFRLICMKKAGHALKRAKAKEKK